MSSGISRGGEISVIVLSIKDEISLDGETALFEKAIESASNQGPLFVVLAIDTPGGREDLMKRLCKAIVKASNCKTVAYVCGGQYGGAYSAGAIISLACDYIYMADNTAIGAAMTVVISSEGEVKDLKSKFGEAVAEKYMSADRAFVAAVAEENGRSPAIGKGDGGQGHQGYRSRRRWKEKIYRAEGPKSGPVRRAYPQRKRKTAYADRRPGR